MNRNHTALVTVATFATLLAACPSPPSSDASQADARIPSDAATDAQPSTDAAAPVEIDAILRNLQTYENGGSFDSDGDGTDDITVTVNPDGSRDTVVAGSSHPYLTIHWHDEQHVDGIGDFDQDGTPDYTYSLSGDADTVTEVETWDTDADGTEDLRKTRVFSGRTTDAPRMRTTTEELQLQDMAGTRAFVPIETRDEPPINNQCSPPAPAAGGTANDMLTCAPGTPPPLPRSCDRLDDFDVAASRALGRIVETAIPHIHIIAASDGTLRDPPCTPDVGCTPPQIETLQRVLPMAIRDAMNCYPDWNQELDALMHNLLARRQVYIGCTNRCADATTNVPSCWGDLGEIDMNIRSTNLSLSDDGVEEILIHELLHAAGKAHTALESRGMDQVYSCGRFCNRCRISSFVSNVPADRSSAYDCANCAGADHKIDCGAPRQWVTYGNCETHAVTPSRTAGFCVNTTNGTTVPACSCAHVHWGYCDWERLEPRDRMSPTQIDDVNFCATYDCPATSPMPEPPCLTDMRTEVPDVRTNRAWPHCDPVPMCNY